MQKKLIALAVAGLASTAAFAQSNVTIYGVADATFDTYKASGSAASATDVGSKNRVTSNSSYIGFKGVEDLGNGLKAAFQLENGVNFDNGAAGAWNNRDSYVGLVGGFGTVVAGNVTGPTRALGAKFDVNAGATGVGANTALIGKIGGGQGASHFDQRLNNAIAYISPSFSGFSAVAGYTTGYTASGLVAKEASVANPAAGNTGMTLGLNYDNGPIYVGYAYTAVKGEDNGTGVVAATYKKAENNRLGAMYNFGQGSVGLLWDNTKFTAVAGGTDVKNTVYYLSGKYNVTPAGKIIAQYGIAKNMTATAADDGAKHLVIGYEHSLSKRTVVKAVYSAITNNAGATYDFLYGAAASTATAAASAAAGADPKSISVGVRHSF
ncbi:MAG: hypothetical protein RIR00_1442 [Pseudomonadota bacterium]|jgi:predicted porin